MLRMRSRSWIIRSRTTSTSVPRSPNCARRWHSMKRGSVDAPAERADGRVEALEMPDLQHAAAAHRQLEQRLALLDRRGERLLDQDVDAGLEQVARHRVVTRGRHRDAGAVDPAGERAVIRQRRHAERLAHRPRARRVDVDDRRQLDLRDARRTSRRGSARDGPPRRPPLAAVRSRRTSLARSTATTAMSGRVRQREHLRAGRG